MKNLHTQSLLEIVELFSNDQIELIELVKILSRISTLS